jgi:hypothetical protein
MTAPLELGSFQGWVVYVIISPLKLTRMVLKEIAENVATDVSIFKARFELFRPCDKIGKKWFRSRFPD